MLERLRIVPLLFRAFIMIIPAYILWRKSDDRKSWRQFEHREGPAYDDFRAELEEDK